MSGESEIVHSGGLARLRHIPCADVIDGCYAPTSFPHK